MIFPLFLKAPLAAWKEWLNYARIVGFMRKFVSSLLVLALTTMWLPVKSTMAQSPVTFVRRAEAVMILLKSADIAVDTNARTNGIYPDVLDGEWYVPYVVKGLEMDMLSVERETGLLYPHRSVSRAEFLYMLTKAFELTSNIPYQFTDISKDAWYAPYVGLAWRYKLFVSENNPELLQPNRRITHAEATEAIYSLLSAEPSLQPHPNMFPVRQELPEEPKRNLLQTLLHTLRSTSIKKAVTPNVIHNDPQAVKLVMMQLIRSRENQAEHTRNEMIDLINQVRARYNLGPVRSNYYLELSAQRHAKDMHDRGYFSHFTPEGFSYVERIKSTGYLSTNPSACACYQDTGATGSPTQLGPGYVVNQQDCSCEPSFSLGENLAKGQLSVEQVMEDWLDSPNHRKNILRPQFDEIGIGLFGDIWVQNFGHLELP